MKKFTLLTLFLTLFFTGLFAQPGTLDLSFNDSGKVITVIYDTIKKIPIFSHAYLIAIQNDGRILVSGNGWNDGYKGWYETMRYKSNGTVDSGFGANGLAIKQFGEKKKPGVPFVSGLFIQNDNKIIVAGDAPASNHQGFQLLKYFPDGSIDTSVHADWDPQFYYAQNATGAMQLPDEKILQVGYAYYYDSQSVLAVKYDTNNKIDSSFGRNGFSELGNLKDNDISNSAGGAIQKDGKIIIVVNSRTGLNFTTTGLMRYDSTGKIDSTFGKNGRVLVSIHKNDTCFGRSLAIMPNDDIFFAGNEAYKGSSDFFLTKFNKNGKVDSSFGRNGNLITDFGGYDECSSVLITSKNKILLGGRRGIDKFNFGDFAIAQYNLNGKLDSSFGVKGKVITHFAGYDDGYVGNIAEQADGKIIVAGEARTPARSVFAVVRYNEESSVLATVVSNLKGSLQNNQVALNWTALNELNIKNYNIQRSPDGNNFSSIGTVFAVNNNTQKIDYSYVDANPLKSKNYYRLMFTDADGKVSYSNTVLVNLQRSFHYILSPNPAKDIIVVNGLSSSPKSIRLFSIDGKLLQSVNTSGETCYLNIHRLPTGTYVIKITEGKSDTSLSFIKE